LIPGGPFAAAVEFFNRGFSSLQNPRPVYIALMRDDEMVGYWLMDTDPRHWQPFEPMDESCTPLLYTIRLNAELPEDFPPGTYHVGLWMPDGFDGLREDPRYAVRVANGDVPWWTDYQGRYGVNVLGILEVVTA
jgi:hypothetical protein